MTRRCAGRTELSVILFLAVSFVPGVRAGAQAVSEWELASALPIELGTQLSIGRDGTACQLNFLQGILACVSPTPSPEFRRISLTGDALRGQVFSATRVVTVNSDSVYVLDMASGAVGRVVGNGLDIVAVPSLKKIKNSSSVVIGSNGGVVSMIIAGAAMEGVSAIHSIKISGPPSELFSFGELSVSSKSDVVRRLFGGGLVAYRGREILGVRQRPYELVAYREDGTVRSRVAGPLGVQVAGPDEAFEIDEHGQAYIPSPSPPVGERLAGVFPLEKGAVIVRVGVDSIAFDLFQEGSSRAQTVARLPVSRFARGLWVADIVRLRFIAPSQCEAGRCYVSVSLPGGGVK